MQYKISNLDEYQASLQDTEYNFLPRQTYGVTLFLLEKMKNEKVSYIQGEFISREPSEIKPNRANPCQLFNP